VYIDTVGDPEFYKSRLVNALGADYGTFIIEKKADATYKVVGAASIVAKVCLCVFMCVCSCVCVAQAEEP
jgi:ribonuclease HII